MIMCVVSRCAIAFGDCIHGPIAVSGGHAFHICSTGTLLHHDMYFGSTFECIEHMFGEGLVHSFRMIIAVHNYREGFDFLHSSPCMRNRLMRQVSQYLTLCYAMMY